MSWLNGQNRRKIIPFLSMLALLVLFLVQLLEFGSSDTQTNGRTNLPVSIRANSQADYSPDANPLLVPPVHENIFEQIIHDLQGTGSPDDRISTLQVSLSEPVPTMTLHPQLPTSTFNPFANTPNTIGSTTPRGTVSAPGTVTTATPTGSLVHVTPSAPSSTSAPVATIASPATKKPKPTQRPRPTRRP